VFSFASPSNRRFLEPIMGVTGNTSFCHITYKALPATLIAPLSLGLILPFIVSLVTLCSVFMATEAAAQPKPPALAVIQMQRLARYTMAKLEPDPAQQNPLASTISIHLPRESVRTVGDAVRYLLVRTGYRLADGLSAEVADVLALTLPDVHRQLGPYTVTEALNVLLGASYTLDVDASRRVVAYRAAGSSATGIAGTATPSSTPAIVPSTAAVSALKNTPSVVASRELKDDTPSSAVNDASRK
jgi:conjugative transfer region protein (TIGR03748 family)